MYLLLFSISGVFYKKPIKSSLSNQNTFLILVPAYKEKEALLNATKQNLLVRFPKHQFRLVVIADSLDEDAIAELRKMPIDLFKVGFSKSTKAKAINAALQQIDVSKYTHTVVLDADNVLKEDFLIQVDSVLNPSMLALQTHRTAKNKNSPMALLDGANEEIGNHIFRKGHRAIGLSSALIGSGMVFKTETFVRLMTPIRDTAGEDKMLEFALLEEKIKVEYIEDAIVYDEKLTQKSQFEGQRTRWVTARFFFLGQYASKAFSKLLKGDVDYFNKWFQFLLPQKLLLAFYVSIFWLISLFVPSFFVAATLMLALLGSAFFLAIPKRYYTRELVKAFLIVPGLALGMLSVLVKAKTADPTHFNVTQK